MPDTITESELTAIEESYYAQNVVKTDLLHFAIEHLGITVVPDPIPEPEGDVIVVDVNGKIWRRGVTGWMCDKGIRATAWNAVTEMQGPVKIYRLEESA